MLRVAWAVALAAARTNKKTLGRTANNQTSQIINR
jgi:hypothetical protein